MERCRAAGRGPERKENDGEDGRTESVKAWRGATVAEVSSGGGGGERQRQRAGGGEVKQRRAAGPGAGGRYWRLPVVRTALGRAWAKIDDSTNVCCTSDEKRSALRQQRPSRERNPARALRRASCIGAGAAHPQSAREAPAAASCAEGRRGCAGSARHTSTRRARS
jgi:hypothetical protein